MSFPPYKSGYAPKIELKAKECIDAVLRPLNDHVTIKINGSLTSEDVFRTVVSMAVNRNSVHSVSTQYQDVACETSLRYHLNKLNMDELIKSNEEIPLQELMKTLCPFAECNLSQSPKSTECPLKTSSISLIGAPREIAPCSSAMTCLWNGRQL